MSSMGNIARSAGPIVPILRLSVSGNFSASIMGMRLPRVRFWGMYGETQYGLQNRSCGNCPIGYGFLTGECFMCCCREFAACKFAGCTVERR